LVGTGPLAGATRRLAHRRGIVDRIDWLGYRTAPQSMPAFDIFVLPSRYEGMSYVLMEAVSLAIPVVATDVGGASMIVEHQRNGLLVPPDRPEQLAEAVQRLIADPGLRAEYSAAAQKKRREFSVERMVQSTLELYWTLCPNCGEPRSARRVNGGTTV
jgi:glycosyltransferase involved in cell wall biosynthesis